MEATTATETNLKPMKITNAINKLTKAGFNVINDGGKFSASKAGCNYLVEFWRNGSSDEVTCLGYRHREDHNDSMTDYCATFFCDSLKQAIMRATAIRA